MSKEILSQCCGHYAYGEVDQYNTGTCGKWHEGTSFEIIEE